MLKSICEFGNHWPIASFLPLIRSYVYEIRIQYSYVSVFLEAIHQSFLPQIIQTAEFASAYS